MSRSIAWQDGKIHLVDQRALPGTHSWLRIATVDELIEAITTLAVRGAPALALVGALGVALSASKHTSVAGVDHTSVRADAHRIAQSRPTAVNLSWGVKRALKRVAEGAEAVLAEALTMLEDDERLNRAAARHAADFIANVAQGDRLRILTHCNTGRLATGAWGTALGAIRDLHERDLVREVLATETRPLLQGARLTVWELQEENIPVRLGPDSAAASAMQAGDVDCVIVGADRIAANGDVANKIGTYPLALAAARHHIPFIVVAPESTIDVSLLDGTTIPIEQRGPEEVTSVAGVQVAPSGTAVYNPAFDVTPHDLISAIVTERGIWTPRPTDLERDLERFTAVVHDYPTPGVVFQDLAGAYRHAGLLRAAGRELARRARGTFNAVVGIEARGFILASVLAADAGVPLVLARKPGKTPGKIQSTTYRSEYSEDQLEIPADALGPQHDVLVIDDVLATGGTLEAARLLVEACGARVSRFGVITQIAALGGASRLAPTPVDALRTVPPPQQ
ncbi:S-methyl-5-thioribose-1-phosphate isomerase [Streptomyces meridianus]|uniref:Methylthioribose-1-phosphate isomerase n=1 Tax=Streptomyces meridianus TaxID=2938945 RepID=A0ABT0XCU2_9ACTN|nr:S-methyl-5-thioribose-1-phosphate isomerase [Streptomyces meridianus]MCM2579604.1 S-methyl-5-thioribose-1-phosphate isomerase [Streptomyces meridianus]